MSNNNLYLKNTTFTKTPGLPQMASYLVFLTEVILFYGFVLPNLRAPAQAALGVLYSISLLALVIASLASSVVDPSD
jgi:hypothetical protein